MPNPLARIRTMWRRSKGPVAWLLTLTGLTWVFTGWAVAIGLLVAGHGGAGLAALGVWALTVLMLLVLVGEAEES